MTEESEFWIPACAGMIELIYVDNNSVIVKNIGNIFHKQDNSIYIMIFKALQPLW
jgi:hypothetical protein